MATSDPTQIEAARESARIWRWQQRLLPFVLGGVALLALFFFISTFIQLGRLNEAVAFTPDTQLETTLKQIDARAAKLPALEATELLRWKTMVVLEADVVRHRYAQVNSTLLMRAWTRHIGFVTGMILTFMGALFILTKLSEAQTQLGGEAAGAKATLATSSPGIVLAVLGTALMLVTLTANFKYGTSDAPVYLPALAPSAMPAPAAMQEEGETPEDPGATPPPPIKPKPDTNDAPH
ncbi:hypothetical protein IAG41_08875 [Sphingomonas sp. JC676]|uniref:hypothetical protein n=1 Tax=Sphingomonas sp. JC676 TaxID=2768065 RepID=UPI0016582CF9|nr:hypothetical protein [Sphingomonas sp. JC676]MBC9032502.1 hypothetical protein [Sphingomonas sp. JC676]